MAPAAVLDRVLRDNRGRLLAALSACADDLQRAEDALQAACGSALVRWSRAGAVSRRKVFWLCRNR